MLIRTPLAALLSIVVSAASAAQPASPQMFAKNIISAPVSVAAPAFTPDGKTVYFHRNEGGQRTIYVSHEDADVWSAPTVASFAKRWINIEPAIAPDGSYIVFASNRPIDGSGKVLDGAWGRSPKPGRGGNLWRAERIGSGWSAPHRLPRDVNQGTSVYAPAISSDGTLLFMRAGADGMFHLFEAQPLGASYSVKPLPFSKQGVSDYDPAIASDGSYLVFCSDRAGPGLSAIYIAFRSANGSWSAPRRLPDPFNGAKDVTELRLSPDGSRLYFAHDGSIWSLRFAEVREQLRAAAERL